tara:strand:+ start:657 stop:2336 length:1680 start_codon:yes stop_codon:yes gene_type:complete
MARSRDNVVPQGQINIVRPKRGIDMFFETLSEYYDPSYQLERKKQDALLTLRNKELDATIKNNESNALYKNKTLNLQKNELELNENKFAETQKQNKIINDNNLVATFFEDREKGYTDDEISSMNSTLGLDANAMKMFRAKNNKLNKDYKQKQNVSNALSKVAQNVLGETLDPVLFQSGEVSLDDINNLWKQKISNEKTITPEKKIRLESLFKTVTELEKQRALLGDFQDTGAIDNRIQGYYNQINKLAPNLDPIKFEPYTPNTEQDSDDWSINNMFSGGFLGAGTPKKQTDQNQQLSLEDIVSGSPIGLNVSDTTGTDTTKTNTTVGDTAVTDTTGTDTTGVDTTFTRPKDAPDDAPRWMFAPITQTADSTAQDTEYDDLFGPEEATSGISPSMAKSPSNNLEVNMEGDVDVPNIDYLLDELKPEAQRIKVQDRNIPKKFREFNPTTGKNFEEIKETSSINFNQPVGKFNKDLDSLYSSISKINKQLKSSGVKNGEALKKTGIKNIEDMINLLENISNVKGASISDKNKISILKNFAKKKGFRDTTHLIENLNQIKRWL